MQDNEHSAVQPENWGATSTLTISAEFRVDVPLGVMFVSGTITINDVEGEESIPFNVAITEV